MEQHLRSLYGQCYVPSSSMDSTLERLSRVSSLTYNTHDNTGQSIINEALLPLSHLKEIVMHRFIELKPTLLVESCGTSLLEVSYS